MPVVVRYFDVSAAGSGNGTSFANRAALLTGVNVLNPIITGFNFAGSDSLMCLVESGTYPLAWPQLSTITTPPRVQNRLIFHAAKNGVPWQPPRDWNCCQPSWDDSDMPRLNWSTIVGNVHSTSFIGFVVSSGSGNAWIQNLINFRHCIFDRASTSSTQSISAAWGSFESCVFRLSASPGFANAIGNNVLFGLVKNCRFEDLTTNSAGNCRGVSSTSVIMTNLQGNCFIGFLTGAYIQHTSTIYPNIMLSGSTFINCQRGFHMDGVPSQNSGFYGAYSSVFHNCTTGIDIGSGADIGSCVFDNCMTPVTNSGNWPINDLNFSGAIDFVDAANGDYRIAYGSPYWGKGIGAGDGPRPTKRLFSNFG